MDNQQVSLGCGTLILIALIVLILGNTGSEEVMKEIEALRRETRELAESIDRLHREVGEVKLLLEVR